MEEITHAKKAILEEVQANSGGCKEMQLLPVLYHYNFDICAAALDQLVEEGELACLEYEWRMTPELSRVKCFFYTPTEVYDD